MVVVAAALAAVLISLPLGFLLGKRASLWCPGCGATTRREPRTAGGSRADGPALGWTGAADRPTPGPGWPGNAAGSNYRRPPGDSVHGRAAPDKA